MCGFFAILQIATAATDMAANYEDGGGGWLEIVIKPHKISCIIVNMSHKHFEISLR